MATNLSYCGTNIRSIMITSRTAHEGKSFISLNLLRTFASLGKRVVLVDTDLRRSVMASRFQMQISAPVGLSQYLAGVCEIEDAVCSTNIPNAYVVPCGRTVENSLQLLATPRMKEMMDVLSGSFDLVLIDTAPAGTISDALEIAKYCSGALIVVGYNVGHKREIIELADSIQRTGCPVLGVELNQVEINSLANRNSYYGYGKYYHYYHHHSNDEEEPEKKGLLAKLKAKKKA